MAVFDQLSDATSIYEEAAYVVRNAPGEGMSDDTTIVTGAALFVADAANEDLAKAMVDAGQAFLIEQEEWQP